jgi:hypothetical protein
VKLFLVTPLKRGPFYGSGPDPDGDHVCDVVDREDRRIERGRLQFPARTIRYAITLQRNTKESCVELPVLVLIVPVLTAYLPNAIPVNTALAEPFEISTSMVRNALLSSVGNPPFLCQSLMQTCPLAFFNPVT